jgi:hypothetical protein
MGDRVVLLESVLTATPLYILSLYKLSIKIKKKLDSIGCQFLWQGTSQRRKFALISWKWICMPRQLGGLGVTDLHYMNISLLLK